MRRVLLPLFALAMLFTAGCSSRKEAEDQHKQATSNVAAGIFEVATALEQVIPADAPNIRVIRMQLTAIKWAAATIIETQGRRWPRAERWLQSATQPPKREDDP